MSLKSQPSDQVVEVNRSLSVHGLALKLQEGVEIKDRRYSLRKYKRCFIGEASEMLTLNSAHFMQNNYTVIIIFQL